jgi:O-methyltransferase
MQFPPYPPAVAQRIEQYHDDVRYATLALGIQRLEQEKIPGAFAEIGVYRGVTTSFIHRQAPDRRYYLFDTFEGFPQQSLEVASDTRFRDTSQEGVAALIGDTRNIEFRKGFFPDTAAGLESERFALVILDVDLYQPALDVLRFFYPRMVRGAYLFMHDFNSPESNHGISRAAYEFMSDKPELLIEIPDFHGSALFRKQ